MADTVHSCGGLRARGPLQALAQLSRVHLVLWGALVSNILCHQVSQHRKPAQERNLRCQPHLAHRRTCLDVRQLLLSGQILFSIFMFWSIHKRMRLQPSPVQNQMLLFFCCSLITVYCKVIDAALPPITSIIKGNPKLFACFEPKITILSLFKILTNIIQNASRWANFTNMILL